MKKKILKASLLTLCAVTLVVVSVLTTIALLTASSGVSNVFTVGNISIAMWESKVNSDGVRVEADGETALAANKTPIKVDTNSYHLVPGKTYIKDPTIYIQSGDASSNVLDNMYLFVKSSNMIRSAEAGNYSDRVRDDNEKVTDASHTPLSMREQMEKYGWIEFVRSDDGTEIVWVYGKRDDKTGQITPEKVNKSTVQLVDGVEPSGAVPGVFKLCDSFTTHQYVDTTVYGAASVTFTGFAIQTTGFGTGNETGNALTTAAWKALKESFPYKCGIDNPVNPYDLSKKNEAAYEAVGAPEGKEYAPDAVFKLLTPPNKSNETSGGSESQN